MLQMVVLFFLTIYTIEYFTKDYKNIIELLFRISFSATCSLLLFTKILALMKKSFFMRVFFKIFGFCVILLKYGKGQALTLDLRIEEFKKFIINEVSNENFDEIQIIGHSAGSILGIDIVVKVLEEMSLIDIKNITFITLGQCIPIITLQSGDGAIKLRRSLKTLLTFDELLWVDYFDYDDKTSMPGHSKAKEISTDFSSLYKQKKYTTFNMHKRHFLYIMSTDYPGGYDYFKLTAGNMYARDFIKHTSHKENKV